MLFYKNIYLIIMLYKKALLSNKFYIILKIYNNFN